MVSLPRYGGSLLIGSMIRATSATAMPCGAAANSNRFAAGSSPVYATATVGVGFDNFGAGSVLPDTLATSFIRSLAASNQASTGSGSSGVGSLAGFTLPRDARSMSVLRNRLPPSSGASGGALRYSSAFAPGPAVVSTCTPAGAACSSFSRDSLNTSEPGRNLSPSSFNRHTSKTTSFCCAGQALTLAQNSSSGNSVVASVRSPSTGTRYALPSISIACPPK